jgi:hypothetical protein
MLLPVLGFEHLFLRKQFDFLPRCYATRETPPTIIIINQLTFSAISGLYYKPITIINDDSNVVNKLETLLIDDVRVIIYDHHMFIVQATGSSVGPRYVLQLLFSEKSQDC